MRETEYSLFQASLASASNTFDALFEEHYTHLCNYAFSIVNDFDVAEDIVQDLFANLWVNRNRIKIKTKVSAYLLRSVYNACLDHHKHGKVRSQFRQQILRKDESNFQESLNDFELPERIDRAIEELPTECRKIFIMSRFEGRKYHEIASLLNISENTVDTQIRRALKQLRDKLKDYLITTLHIFLPNF